MREAPVAVASAAKHHHHSHKKEAPHPPSLTREAAVSNEAPTASVSVKKHHHAHKTLRRSPAPKATAAKMTSPPPRKATEAATSPPPVPQWMRRTGPSPAERNYAAVAESLARDALQAKKEAAAMRGARAARRGPARARRAPAADGGLARGGAAFAPPGLHQFAAASTSPALRRAARGPLRRIRRRVAGAGAALRADDAEPAAAEVWRRGLPRLPASPSARSRPATGRDSKPAVGARHPFKFTVVSGSRRLASSTRMLMRIPLCPSTEKTSD